MTPLVARDRERQGLVEELARAGAERGRVVLIQGEAGIGKSRLAQEAIDTRHWRVLSGCAERDGAPYAHVAQIVRQGLHLEPALLERLAHLRPRLATLLPELGPAEPGDAAGLRAVLTATVAALADAAPSALLLEDLHAADVATIELLPALAAMQPHRPLALIATVRDEPLPGGHPLHGIRAALRQQSRLRDLRLGTLTRDEVAAMAAGILGGAMEPVLAALLAARTNGVPLFVEELTRTLRDLGRLAHGAQGWELAGGDELPVPEGIRDAVALRLDGCAEVVRHTLQAAALAHDLADAAKLARLVGADPPWDEVCATGLVTCDGRLHWRHDLLREAVAAEIPWSRRRAWHGVIAEGLGAHAGDPALEARHREQAGDEAGARRAWLAAGAARSRVFAHRDAVTALQRAVASWPAGEAPGERRRAFAELGAAALAAGDAAEAARAWREVLDQRDDQAGAGERARAWRALAVATSLQGVWHQSMAARREAMAAFIAAGEPGEASADHLAIGGHHLAQRQLRDARHELELAVVGARAAGVVALEARILASLATVLGMQGDARGAQELIDRALRLALDANETAAAADVYRRVGTLHEMSSDYAAACDAYETALGFCRTQALPGAARTCMGCMTWALFQAGDWKRAQLVVRDVTGDPLAPASSRAVGHMVGGLMAVLRDQRPRARRELDRAEELARCEELDPVLWAVAWGRALLAEAGDDHAGAAAFHRASIAHWESSQDLVEAVPLLASAAACFATIGDRAWLDRTVAGLRRCADGVANPETIAGLARGLGEQALRDGRTADARAHFAQALDLLDDGGLLLDRLHTAWRAAQAALLAGDRAGAALLARGARRGAATLKAQLWLDRLRALPEQDDAGPVVADSTLTSRQREVLRLLAKGCTNRRIGALLGLSSRTVDMHVARILDRLGSGTRTEAALRAEELGLLE
jgi:DNA-binding CsgD family transcriptional regulator